MIYVGVVVVISVGVVVVICVGVVVEDDNTGGLFGKNICMYVFVIIYCVGACVYRLLCFTYLL